MAAGKERGFTVTELLVVVLIILIVAGMLGPSVASGLRRTRASSGASEVTTALRRARNLAIVRSERVIAKSLRANPDLPDGHANKYARVKIFVYEDGVPNNEGETLGGYVLPPTTDFRSEADVIFFPDGTATGNGFTAPPALEFGAEGDDEPTRRIDISPLTGRFSVTLVDGDGGP